MEQNAEPLITLSWENINVYTPGEKARKLPLCGTEGTPSKHIVKNGKPKYFYSVCFNLFMNLCFFFSSDWCCKTRIIDGNYGMKLFSLENLKFFDFLIKFSLKN